MCNEKRENRSWEVFHPFIYFYRHLERQSLRVRGRQLELDSQRARELKSLKSRAQSRDRNLELESQRARANTTKYPLGQPFSKDQWRPSIGVKQFLWNTLYLTSQVIDFYRPFSLESLFFRDESSSSSSESDNKSSNKKSSKKKKTSSIKKKSGGGKDKKSSKKQRRKNESSSSSFDSSSSDSDSD